MTTARAMPWRARTAATRRRWHVHSPSRPDRASFSDYAAGRVDRLGHELLIQIGRRPAPPAYRLHNSMLVSAPIDAATLIASVAWIHPDLVWIHAAEPLDAYRAAPMLAAAGREIVVIDDDWSAAEELGLLRRT